MHQCGSETTVNNLAKQMIDDWRDRRGNFVCRRDSRLATSGALGPKYLANLDSRGEGPPGKIRCGRNTLYPVQDFFPWFLNRKAS